jgi:hypothetical protein
MKIQTAGLTLGLILGLALALPIAVVHAQASKVLPLPDRQYCQSLADSYTTYVNDPNSRRPAPANASVQSAIAQCQTGNTAAGIPALEKALVNAGFTLPARK